MARLGQALIILALVAGGFWMFGPYEPAEIDFTAPAFDVAGLDAHFAAAEAPFALTPGVQKRVVWAGATGRQTPLSVVYLHGFSATSEEIRPVPDRVAAALGANLVFDRLAGHGLGSAAMVGPRVADWTRDVAEALAAGRAAGREVLVIATSTGGTLAALAMLDREQARNIRGVVLISPNFGLGDRRTRILTWPAVRWWGPLVGGLVRDLTPVNPDHGRYWTTRYPTVALLPLAALVAHARGQDYTQARVPALVLYSPDDTVVQPAATERVAAQWGGPLTLEPQRLPPGNDPASHVITGDILSPDMTDPFVERILRWSATL